MEYQEITRKIIGCAYKVYNTLGFGFLESVYENSLMIELKKAGLEAKQQFSIDVYYEGYCVGTFKSDIIVDDLIILELKSVQNIVKEFEVQLVNYLTATKKDLGLLINFGKQKVQVKRKVRVLPDKNYSLKILFHPVHPVNY